jgi:transcriptional regulator with XRE-family HTH domain
MLPFTRLVLRKPRTKPPETLGEHIRAARQKRHLLQREAAPMLGVIPATLLHWEKGQTIPPITAMPAIVRFLGYDPSPIPDATSFGGRMAAYRRQHGLSIKAAAARAGVDECSWGTWERTGTIPTKSARQRLEALLSATEQSQKKI